MRRTSRAAREVSRAMSERGLPVSPRRLEDWTSRGLSPLEGAPFDRQLDHYAALARLCRSGRDADLVALRLASLGFACSRLRGALLRRLGLRDADRVAPPRIDLSSETSGDAAFAEIEQVAQALLSSTDELPLAMGKIVEALRANAHRSAASLSETGDQIFYSFVVNWLVYFVGDDLYNEKALAAVMGLAPNDVGTDLLEFLNHQVRLDMAQLDDAYRTVPLEHISALAGWLRGMAPTAMQHLGISGIPDAELDVLAALLAPAFFHGLKMIKENLAVGELPMPDALLVLE